VDKVERPEVRTVEERLEEVEQVVARLVSPLLATPNGEGGRGAMVDHGAPHVGEPTPGRWRRLTVAELERRWRDLFEWVEWMLEAFDVRISRAEEGMWWSSPGAAEELSALRDWHRELVDVEIRPLPPDPVSAESRAADVAFERGEKAVRSMQARDLVAWHEARARVCERLVGSPGQPLMVRWAETAPVARERAEGLRGRREEEFTRFLAVPGPPPSRSD
jgi:hypothetical protein